MRPATAPSALKIQALLGDGFSVVEFDDSTHTAADAAAAIGCAVAQIAKSVIFKAADDTPVLVVASGVNRVDEKAVAALIGQKIKRADPDFVRANTGFVIGGVPPIGHVVAPLTLLDDDLFAPAVIWAAAGAPNAVFQLTPADLLRLTGGRRAIIAAAAKSSNTLGA